MSFESKLVEWLNELDDKKQYTLQIGTLREKGGDEQDKFICFHRDGGRQTGPVNSFPRVRLWIYSQVDCESIDNAISDCGEMADKMFAFATGQMQVCGFVSSKVLGGIIGPKFTDNGRAVYGMTVEFIV